MGTVKLSPLDNVVVFSLGAISLWSGRGRLQPEDFGTSSIDLPPAAVASLGSKRLISREILVKLDQVKRKMHRLCASTGVKFLNGYAVGVDKSEPLSKQLDQLVTEGNTLRQHLLDNFDTMLADWHRENPLWAHILKAGTPEKESVHKRINFGWDAFMVRTPANEKVAQSLLGASASLGSTLYGEIAAEALDFVTKSLKPGREKGSQRTATPIRRLVEKMRGLQFLDHRIQPLTQVFDQIVASIPTTGVIEGQSYLCMLRCAYVLADVNEMQRLGERAFNGESADALCAEIVGDSSASAQVAAASADAVAVVASQPAQMAVDHGEQLVVSADELFDDTKLVSADGPARQIPDVAPKANPMGENRPVLHMAALSLPKKPTPQAAASLVVAKQVQRPMVVIDF